MGERPPHQPDSRRSEPNTPDASRGPIASDPHAWRYPALTVALTALFVWEFVEVAARVMLGGAIVQADAGVSAAIAQLRSDALTRLFWYATLAGQLGFLAVAGLVIAVLLGLFGRRREAAFFALALTAGAAGQTMLKDVFDRVRPGVVPPLVALPESYAFPSGHAFASLLFAGLVVFLFWEDFEAPAARAGLLAVGAVFAGLVGISRVYLGVHWASDVVASWWLALAWLSLACGSLTTLSHYRGKPLRSRPVGTPRIRRAALVAGVVSVAVAFLVVAFANPLVAP